MNARKAASVWKICRGHSYDAHARFIARGALAGEHVVEIESGHALSTSDFRKLLGIADGNKVELSYGKAPRRAIVLS